MEFLYILKDALESGLIWSLLAIGVFISFRILDFADLTVEGTITLGAAIASSVMMKEIPFVSSPYVVILLSVLGGALAGSVTGLLHVKCKIPGILAGIISMTALYSINLLIMKGASLYIRDLPTLYNPLEYLFRNIFGITNMEIVKFLTKTVTNLLLNVIVFFGLYWFFGTEIGMAIRATGNNRHMAKAQGIDIDKMIILGLAVSNAIVALSGALYVQSYKTSNMDLGRGTIIVGLASIILGEVLIRKVTFKRWLVSVILGSILFQVIIGVAISLGFSANNLKLLQAMLIAVVLAYPTIRTMVKKIRKKGGVSHAEG